MKKFVTVLLGIVMLMSLECASTIWVVRNVISKDNIKYMLDKSNIIDEEFDSIDAELEGIVDKDELANEIISIAVDQFYYRAGVDSRKPNTDKLEKILEKYAEELEEKTGEKEEIPDMDEILDELDEEIYDDLFENIENNHLGFVIDIFFKNTLIFICIGIIIACLILIFALRKEFGVVLFHTGLVSILNGIYTGIITLGIKALSTADEELGYVFGNTFRISGVICLIFMVVGIASLVLSFVIKKNENTGISTTTKSPVNNQ